MTPNLLWAIWLFSGLVLETLGILGIFGLRPATYYLSYAWHRWTEPFVFLLAGLAGWLFLHLARAAHRYHSTEKERNR